MHCYSSIPASEYNLTLQWAVLFHPALVQAQFPLLYLQVKKSRTGLGAACLAAEYWTAVEKRHDMWIWYESPANHNLSLLMVSSSGCVNTAMMIYLSWGLTGWRTRKQNFHGHPKAALPMSKTCPAHMVIGGCESLLVCRLLVPRLLGQSIHSSSRSGPYSASSSTFSLLSLPHKWKIPLWEPLSWMIILVSKMY